MTVGVVTLECEVHWEGGVPKLPSAKMMAGNSFTPGDVDSVEGIY